MLSLIKSALGKCHFLRFLGQDVGSVVNPKNRRWQQFWCLNSGMVPHSSVLYLPAISYICCRQIRTSSNSLVYGKFWCLKRINKEALVLSGSYLVVILFIFTFYRRRRLLNSEQWKEKQLLS